MKVGRGECGGEGMGRMWGWKGRSLGGNLRIDMQPERCLVLIVIFLPTVPSLC